jgi:hypothetical protein
MDLGAVIFWTVLSVAILLVIGAFTGLIYFIHSYQPKPKSVKLNVIEAPTILQPPKRPKPTPIAIETLKNAWANAFNTDPTPKQPPSPIINKKRKLTPAELEKRRISTKPRNI